MLRILWFRVQALTIVAFFFVLLMFLYVFVLAGPGQAPRDLSGEFHRWSSVLWALPLIPASITIVGYAIYRRPERPETAAQKLAPIHTPVSFRIVSRGFNVDSLNMTIASIQASMRQCRLFPYVIEVVTDNENPVDLEASGDFDVRQIVVPADYQTPNKSMFKARALEYALWNSTFPDDGWLMHLDEESCVTPSAVVGIRKAVEEEERSGRWRIGQGAILYFNSMKEHPFLTLADSIRSGDDIGRFYVQHRLGLTLFGLHGSFILSRNSVEKDVGFDFGPDGSITEDAFWALVQMQRGRRCRWVEGYIVEQAPLSVKDFLKQRRRWFVGLIKTTALTPVKRRYRVAIGFSVLLWAFSWASVSYTYSNVVVGSAIPLPVVVLANVVFASYISQYVIGLQMNMEEHRTRGLLRKGTLYITQVLLIPVFSLLEGCGVFYGLLRPDAGFHVVKKAGQAG
jgi:beta-1,4-mannosyltransferase